MSNSWMHPQGPCSHRWRLPLQPAQQQLCTSCHLPPSQIRVKPLSCANGAPVGIPNLKACRNWTLCPAVCYVYTEKAGSAKQHPGTVCLKKIGSS